MLVILGLLVGGVLSGQSLIRAAQLRAVTTEFQRYVAATYSFRDKYFYLPGDMPNAASFWGTAANCPGTNTQPSTDATTCNGDGDGSITISANSNEFFRFWQHLANAGLIEGSYTGVTDSSSSTIVATLGKNVPASKLSQGGWFAFYGWGNITSETDANLFMGNYRNLFTFGTTGGNYTEKPILKAEEAWNIDTKLDDGKPGTGNIRAYRRDTDCDNGMVGGTLAATAVYQLSDTVQNGCALLVNLP